MGSNFVFKEIKNKDWSLDVQRDRQTEHLMIGPQNDGRQRRGEPAPRGVSEDYGEAVVSSAKG